MMSPSTFRLPAAPIGVAQKRSWAGSGCVRTLHVLWPASGTWVAMWHPLLIRAVLCKVLIGIYVAGDRRVSKCRIEFNGWDSGKKVKAEFLDYIYDKGESEAAERRPPALHCCPAFRSRASFKENHLPVWSLHNPQDILRRLFILKICHIIIFIRSNRPHLAPPCWLSKLRIRPFVWYICTPYHRVHKREKYHWRPYYQQTPSAFSYTDDTYWLGQVYTSRMIILHYEEVIQALFDP